MTNALAAIRKPVRAVARGVARGLDRLSGGRLTPNGVTWFGLAMHVPVAWLITTGDWGWAALGLAVFGLLDTLDGELARLQGRASVRGMLLDASTDRMKEVLLYTAAAYALALGERPETAAWAAAACGASLCVSYVKAKGEAAVASAETAGAKIPHATLNRMFADGIMTFEVRMAVLVVGLLTGYLASAVAVIAVLASFTAIGRLVKISRQLT